MLFRVLLILMILSPALASGQGMTFKEALEVGLAGNHALKAAGLDQDARRSGADVSRSAYLPRLFLVEDLGTSTIPSQAFIMKMDQGALSSADFSPAVMNDPDRKTNFQTSVTLQQPLYDAAIARSLDMAEHEVAAGDFRLEAEKERTALAIYAAFVRIKRSTGRLSVAEQAVLSAREQERLARVRREQGAGLKSEELRARMNLSELEQQRIAAGNAVELAKLDLARLLGQPPGSKIEILDDPPLLQIPADQEALVAMAMSNRKDLHELEVRQRQAVTGVSQARGSYLPTVYGRVGYQANGDTHPFARDNDGWFAGASLNWELFDGMRRNSSLEQMLQKQQAAALRLQEMRSTIYQQLMEKILTRDELGKRLEAVRHALLDAEEGVRLVRNRYQNSLGLYIELLDSELALNRSRTALVDAEVEYSLAGAEVLHAAGTLLKEVVR